MSTTTDGTKPLHQALLALEALMQGIQGINPGSAEGHLAELAHTQIGIVANGLREQFEAEAA